MGSAVYIGKWRKEAMEFLKKNAQALTERKVWLFSSGPTGEGDPVELLKGWRIRSEMQPFVDQIKPRDIAVFHGKIEMAKINFLEKMMIKNVKAVVGDFRDWQAITNWATTIAKTIQKSD